MKKTSLLLLLCALISFSCTNDIIEEPEVQNINSDIQRLVLPDGYNDNVEVTPPGVTRVGGGLNTAIFGLSPTAWIIDTGIDLDHPDLTVDLLRSKSFDINTPDNPNDTNGHGTRVAGVIGAKRNGIGTVGVYPGATLVAVKIQKGNANSYVQALEYVLDLANPGDVVNISIGISQSDIVDNLVIDIANKGVKVVIAAGNEFWDLDVNTNYSPHNVNGPNIFTVSAMDDFDNYWIDSNYGSSIDYCAPGVDIYTTNNNGSYILVDGTSFAAPHVAGVFLYPQTIDLFLLM